MELPDDGLSYENRRSRSFGFIEIRKKTLLAEVSDESFGDLIIAFLPRDSNPG